MDALVKPEFAAIGGGHAIIQSVLPLILSRFAITGQHLYPVVGVEALFLEVRLTKPFIDGKAQNALGLFADIHMLESGGVCSPHDGLQRSYKFFILLLTAASRGFCQ